MDTNTAKRILRSHREFIICSGNWDEEGERLMCEALQIAIDCIELAELVNKAIEEIDSNDG